MSSLRIAALILVIAVSRAGAEQPLSSAYGGAAAVTPLGMANKWVGGAASVDGARLMDFIARRDPVIHQTVWDWELAGGPSTVGLSTRIWGKVTAAYSSPVTGAKWFYVDDGSRCVSDFGDVGVLVYSDEEVEVGQFVTLTGVADVEQSMDSPGRLVRVLRCIPPREYPSYPFSDEFDGGSLNARWLVLGDGTRLSLSTEPGCLLWLYPKDEPDGDYYPGDSSAVSIRQPAPGDWEVEVRMRIELGGGDGYAAIGVALGPSTWLRVPTVLVVGVLNGSRGIEVNGQRVGEYVGSQLWVRGRAENGTYTQSYSLDGVSYSTEYSGASSGARCFMIGFGGQLQDPSLVAVDYVRFRPL